MVDDEKRGARRHPASRTASLSKQFQRDVAYWTATSSQLSARLRRIVFETLQTPFEGIGKPEPLRNDLRGVWSRRLTKEHRVMYRVTETTVEFLSARSHY